MMNNTRPTAMTPEERDRIIGELERRGAQISIHDPRVTNVQNWILGVIGSGVVGTILWLASNVADLNKNVAVIIQDSQYQKQINSAQDNRLTIYDDRLRAVEREVYPRGSDARRGR